jgi:ribosome-binding protein aMBF1 (putative translation factor)
MEHQDWKQYIIHCKEPLKGTDVKVGSKKQNVPDKSKVMDEKIEKGDLKHQKIDPKLSKEIQKHRLSMGLTQKQLANKLSIPSKLINDIETGKALYNGQQISKIKRFLKII